MKRLAILFSLLAGMAVVAGLAFAQSAPVAFTCIVGNASGKCVDGTIALSGPDTSPPMYASAAGYFQQYDGGGGEFYKIGITTGSTAVCRTFTQSSNAKGTVGTSIIKNISSTTGLVVGELVSGSGVDGTGGTIQTQTGTEIASISGSQVNLTLPLTGTATGNDTIFSNGVTFTGDNTGTLIVDMEGDCYQKTNYRGEPHEWGAYGNGILTSPHDDTQPLQYWLGAYGNVNPTLAPTTAPSNFGPWILTIPANYLVSQPLVCPPAGDIESRANPSGEGPNASPVVRIFTNSFAASTDPFVDVVGEPALMIAGNYCRLSGIALDATNIGNFYLQTTGNPVAGTSQINFGSAITAYQGMPISDSDSQIPGSTFLQSNCPLGCTTITLSKPLKCTTTCPSGDTITITGFDTVEDSGSRISIDDRALLAGGYANLRCGGPSNFNAGLEIIDSQIVQGWDEGIHLGGCDNIKLTGDLISANGLGATGTTGTTPDGYGVSSNGQDITIADGVIEQSGGAGLLLSNSNLVSVTSMYFDNNGRYIGGPAISIQNSNYATICSNHIHRSGGLLFYPNTSTPQITSQIYFSGASDSINLCGNVYFADVNPDEATLKPSYVYDAAPPNNGVPQTALTNTQLYELPGPQAAGHVFSPNAAPLVAPLQSPQHTNEITGLTLSNDTSNVQAVDITAGTAADSTGTSLIQLPPSGSSPIACTVNLGAITNGAGGLDTGSVAPTTTYNFFAIASAGGSNGGTPTTSCIASTSLSPSFVNTGTSYALSTTAQGGPIRSTTLYNVASVAGVKIGDVVANGPGSSFVATGTTVTGVQTYTTYTWATPYTGGQSPCVTSSPYNCFTVATTGGLLAKMPVSDNPYNQIANNNSGCKSGMTQYIGLGTITKSANSIVTINPGTTSNVIVLANALAVPLTGTDCFTISGGNEISLSSQTTGNSNFPQNIIVYTGVYRMLGALNTGTGSTPPVVPFAQDGDTFYLNAPVPFDLIGIGTSRSNVTIPSAPTGIAVDAFGRCVATATASGPNYVIIFPGSSSPGTPGSFPATPGYAFQTTTTGSTQATTAFPFRIYTNTTGQIVAQASVLSTLDCMNDGWVWKRAQ